MKAFQAVLPIFFLSSIASLSALTTYTVDTGGDTQPLDGGVISGTNGDLRGCLNAINKRTSADDYRVVFDSSIDTITLAEILPILGLNAANITSLEIDGSGGSSGSVTIDGDATYPGFFIWKSDVTLKNLSIQQTLSQGGNGSGGGMGAGGAIFVAGQSPTVTLENISIQGCRALGGNGGLGGAVISGGGGMFGGNGGDNFYSYGGGGGGFGGQGGEGTIDLFIRSGGGGGIAPGGAGSNVAVGANGEAGSGYIGNQLNPGGSGNFLGSGGNFGGGGGSGVVGGGGGGGLNGSSSNGYFGGDGGAFGGGGGCTTTPTYAGPGGNGGVYGGGGGGKAGGNGGFGGGGGGGSGGDDGGTGGFGGGGGAGLNATPVLGGIGGGKAGTAGGGGAGFGGGIFFMSGGTLNITGSFSVAGCEVANGARGGVSGGNGASAGSGIFAYTNNNDISISLAPASGQTITLNNAIADDNILNLPENDEYREGGSGTLGLTINGPGTVLLVFRNAASHTGPTTLTQGTFQVNGTIPNSEVTVGSLGILAGTGTITQDVTITGGTVRPGSSIGTLTVGSIDFDASSTLSIEISPTASSLLAVTGSATIASGATLYVNSIEASSYSVGTVYTIMTATTSITGGALFEIVSSDPQKEFSLSLDGANQTLYLTLTSAPASSLSTTGLSGNALALADYLNTFGTQNPNLDSVLSALRSLSGQAYLDALEEISPARLEFGRYASENTAFLSSQFLGSRLQTARTLSRKTAPPAPAQEVAAAEEEALFSLSEGTEWTGGEEPTVPEEKRSTIWAAPFGDFAKQSAQNQSPAFHFTSAGILVGADRLVKRGFLVGASLGYASIQVQNDQNTGSQSLNDGFAALYAGWFGPKAFLDLAFWGGVYHSSGKRNISFPGVSEQVQSNYNSWFIDPHLGLGYTFSPLSWLEIEPYGELDSVCNFQPSFTETGTGVLQTTLPSSTSLLLRAEIGVTFRQDIVWEEGGRLFVEEAVAYVNKQPFGTSDIPASIVGTPGGSFDFTTLNTNQSLFSPNISLTYASAKGVAFSLSYDGEFGSGYQSNSITGRLSLSF